MDRKITALMAIAVFGLACFIPLATDDASAETYNVRVSNMYVMHAQTQITNVIPDSFEEQYLYFIEDSSNYNKMQAYLSNPQKNAAPSGDDRSSLKDNMGKMLHIYRFERNNILSIYYLSWLDVDTVLKPYNISQLFEGDPDDVITLKVRSMTDNTGKSVSDGFCLYTKGENGGYSFTYLGTQKKIVIEKDSSFLIAPYWADDALCYDLDLELEISKPNGSATTFMAICFIISAITIALLAVAALKPKWSK